MNDGSAGADPLASPAATVIVTRPAPPAGLEVLLVERSDVGAFAGMWVFPGGQVDDTDLGDDDLARARAAAVREAEEEVGLVIDPASLIPLSHWTPPAITPRRFTTWFFVAPWAGDEVRIDGREIVGAQWIRPAVAVSANLALAPPTYVTLATLAELDTLADLEALIEHRGIERFVTVPARLNGQRVLLWEPDAGHATADPTLPGSRHRLTLTGNTLEGGTTHIYERSD